MSESDEDLMPNIGFQYENQSRADMTNFNNTNITSYTFRNNKMTSTFNTAELQRQRYGMRGFDQRSMCYRRETSPMSLRSFPNTRMQNYPNSFYNRGMSSQRSVLNGRSGSPISMRSIDSNASVSAVDIALAFKTMNFNKYDLRLIKDAYNKFMKNRVRKRVEKRRKLKLFLKGTRRISGDDSGDQGSDSSISSDDCRSTRTFYKENLPISKTLRSDLSNFRNTIKESDMYKDCTDNIKKNAFKNMLSINSTMTHNQTTNNTVANSSSVTLKDRFAKSTSFLLPSQRFNRTTVNPPSSQTLQIHQLNNIRNKPNNRNESKANSSNESDSEKEEIFAEITMRENIQHSNATQCNTATQRKRPLESDERNGSDRKRSKVLLSPIKHSTEAQNNDFNFKMPQMPVRKTSNLKRDVPERLIAKSHEPLSEDLSTSIGSRNLPQPVVTEDNLIYTKSKDVPQNSTEIDDCSSQKDITNNSDVSMRPSFIKRKLFSQKLDVVEKKNISSDNIGVNSPQARIYKEGGEKHKVRKLVTSQSCMSRDILGDNNVLDLIHKIVPPDQMNITSAANKRESTKSNRESNDKWDVASVISMCNDNEGSDTYTDEEIFKTPTTIHKTITKEAINVNAKPVKVTEKASKQKQCNVNKNNTQCKVVLQKLQPRAMNTGTERLEAHETKSQNKRTVSNCVRTFWDTDFESDMEDNKAMPWNSRHQTHQANNVKNTTVIGANFNLNSKRNLTKGTILTVRSFQAKGLNSNKSDISQVSKCKESSFITNQNMKVDSPIKPQKKEVKTKQINNNKVTKQETPKSKPKPKKDTKSSEKNNKKEKPNSKSISSKEKNINDKARDKNTSRESVRLKEKKEKTNLSTSDATKPKRGRPLKEAPDISHDTVKNTNQTNKKSKENSKQDTKAIKNPSIKSATLNRNRQTPKKCNQKLLTTSSDQSSFNISNISNRSLRVRRKVVK